MRILTLTTLYPNAAAPTHGIFVENRLRAMIDEGGIEARVIAPVPWFPSPNAIFGSWAQFAKAPRQEKRHGIEIAHPRYLLPPKIGMTWAAYALADCFEKAALKLIEQGWDFDAIDAHYYYPDGVAAVEAGRRLGKPVVVTARGTDINLIPRYARQRRMILEAAESAQASITVCQALKDEMVALGASADKISVLRNGVDLTLFRPADRDAIRERMHLQGPVLLSVGHLIERKGHHLVLEAAASMPAVTVLIAGDGPERSALEQYAGRIGIAGRVRFLGALPHEQLPELYNAADVLVLASSREGWPNVMLEAMACGARVVTTRVSDVPDVVNAPAAGAWVEERSPESLARIISQLLAAPVPREETRTHALGFTWEATTQGQLGLFREILRRHGADAP